MLTILFHFRFKESVPWLISKSYNQDTDSWISIHLKSKPVKNKANKELIKLLSKKLNIAANQIQIIAGPKNANKTIQIRFYEDISKPKILEKLSN